MKSLFMTYLNASISGSIIILVGLLLRPLFKKVPRRILCTLWLLAAIRLLLPFNIESQFSLQPSPRSLEGLISEQQYQPEFTPPEKLPDPDVPDIDLTPELPPQDLPVIPENPMETTQLSLDWRQALSVAWVMGLSTILLYCAISYILLKHRNLQSH